MLLLVAGGCGLEDDPVAETVDAESVKPDAQARAAYPAGRFEADPPGSGPFASVTLRGNGTFEAESNIVCAHAPCEPPRVEGTYRFTRSGEKRYLHLVGSDGTDVRWAWQKFGDELQIRKAGTQGWQGWHVLGHTTVE